MSPLHKPAAQTDVLRLVREFPLAWVISGRHATPLPLIAECDAAGEIVALVGHFARANPQAAALVDAPEALILFQGPHGYISPELGSDPASAPTWNYAVARYACRVEFVAGETDTALRALTAQAEAANGTNWAVEKMGPRYASMQKRIVAFRAHVLSRHVTFKLGQEERPADLAAIVQSHADRQLAEWMLAAALSED